jgi:hypothetical protein
MVSHELYINIFRVGNINKSMLLCRDGREVVSPPHGKFLFCGDIEP